MQTIGERLEDARKQKGISIREAAESTKIRGEYLQKFESNHFDLGLSNIYVRGFLRTYSNFLKLPAERILNDYSALGHDEPRSRQPSREVYGRMELSVASAADRGDRAAPPPEETAAEAQRAQAKYSRSRTNLPAAPLVDPALVLKIGKISLGVLAVVLVLWAGKAIFGDSSPSVQNSTTAAITPAIGERFVTLVALDSVTVRVVRRNPDNTEGAELFNGTLTRGQTAPVAWPVPSSEGVNKETIFIHATAGENLKIDYKGQSFPTGFTGKNRIKM